MLAVLGDPRVVGIEIRGETESDNGKDNDMTLFHCPGRTQQARDNREGN